MRSHARGRLIRAVSAAFVFRLLPLLGAADCYVAPGGADANSGESPETAFRTLARAASSLRPGDTCWLRAGVYREGVTLTRSGESGHPITFAAYRDESVTLDGADVVNGPWTKAEGRVWKAGVKGPVEAVFCDGQLMVEARWPNCTWSENWVSAKKWALTDAGSTLGRLESAGVAKSGQDFSGGLVYMKLSKGNSCYTRRVLAHHAGSSTVVWDASGLPSRLWREDALPQRIETFGFAGNRFFLVAAGALDAPQEWWYDSETRQLRFITPDGGDPARHEISVKRRIAAFAGTGVGDLVFRGLAFRGCNLRFANSRRIQVQSCRFLYPATLREFPDMVAFKANYQPLWLEGEDNAVERCEISWALDSGVVMAGSGNRVVDCVVHDVNLDGGHPGPGISLEGVPPPSGDPAAMPANLVERCTVYNFGGVGIYAFGHGPARLDRNHLFNGGRYCVDVSSIYIPTGEQMGGSVVDHNWLHAQHGIGFRVDQHGRDITFHHNLVWNSLSGCKLEGFVLSGYNNTVLADNPAFPFMVVFDRGGLPADLGGWRIQNNVALGFIDRLSLRDDAAAAHRERIQPLAMRPGSIDHDVAIPAGRWADYFVDPAAEDFRPKPGGPLDHTGVLVPGVTPPAGEPPSVGALESGVAPWIAGADWLNGALAVPRSPREATELARSLQPADPGK